MLDHHLQRAIVFRLAFAPSLRFSELKPDDIDNKLFDYHLKKVMSAGFVAKNDDGQYVLTPTGRKLGIHALSNGQAIVNQAYSVLFMAVRKADDDTWLLYTRNTHPLLGRTGFMHATPLADELTTVTAQRVLKEKTGLTGNFSALGGGYFRIFDGDALESFTHFTLLVCQDATGELVVDDEFAEYAWRSDPDFTDEEMLPNMPILVEYCRKNAPFYVEETLQAD